MKQVFLLLLLLCTWLWGSAQSDTTFIPFVAYWALGDTLSFEVTKLDQRWEHDSLIKNDTSRYLARFEVVDSTESSYQIKWTYEQDLRGTFGLPEPLLDQLRAYGEMEVLYTTTELGEFVGVDNWEEIGVAVRDLFVLLTDYLGEEDGVLSERFKETMQTMALMFSTKEGVEQLLLKELQVFHFPFGYEYSVEDTMRYEEILPTVVGNNNIRADASLYFTSHDYEWSHCTFHQEMNLNPDDAKAFLLDFFRQLELENEEVEELLRTARYEIIDRNEYEYFYYPGIPVRIVTNREIIMEVGAEKGRRKDVMVIEWVD